MCSFGMNAIKRALSSINVEVQAHNSPPTNSPAPKAFDMGEVTKSPLDSKHYKAIQLPNGLKALLVSTCKHELDSGLPEDDVNLNEKVKEFNRKHLGLGSPPGGGKGGGVKCASGNRKRGSNQKQFLNFQGDLKFGEDRDEFEIVEKVGSEIKSLMDPQERRPPEAFASPAKKPKLVSCCEGPATFSLAVEVGSFHDHPEIYGLAHLVEHMIFLGSDKYPQPNLLFTRTYENKGSANAYTENEYTVYYFSCTSTAFESCLDVLIDGIVNTKITEDLVREEIKAVDSEYGIKQTCDITRLYDFLKSRAKSKHPMKKFHWGNAKSLNHENLLPLLLEWKCRYYCANYMTACIQAPLPIEELEQIAINFLSHIPSSSCNISPTQELLPYGHPFCKEAFRTSYYIAPLTHTTCIWINWFLEPEFWRDYETKPLHYIRQMINTTSPGGLISYLKGKHWICESLSTDVSCKCNDDFCRNSFGTIFGIRIHLTDLGYENRDCVVNAVFSYLKLLRSKGINLSTYQEMQETQAKSFHFKNWDEMLESCTTCAVALLRVPPKHVLTSQNLLLKYDPKKIEECLDKLTPQNANILFVCNTNQEFCKEKAWACNIRFKKEDLSQKRYKDLEDIDILPDFCVPPKGTFMIRNITVGNVETYMKDEIFRSEKVSVKYLSEKKSPCLSQRVPSAKYQLTFASPYATRHMRIKQSSLDLWTKLALEYFVTKLGHEYSDFLDYYSVLGVNEMGINVELSGPSSYLPEFLKLVVEAVFHDAPQCSKETFQDMKVEMMRQCANNLFDTELLCRDILSYLQFSCYSSIFQEKNELNELTYDDFIQLTKLFCRRMNVNVYVEGSLSKTDMESIVRIVEGIEYKATTCISHRWRATIIPLGSNVICVQGVHPGYVTSVVVNYYQVGISDEATWNMVKILYRVLRRRLPNQLRTVEQLGYTVYMSFFDECGSVGLTTTVLTHPHKYTTEHVDTRVDRFFNCFYKVMCKGDNLGKLFGQYFPNNREKLQEIKKFFAEYFLPSGSGYRKLSVQVNGFNPSVQISKRKRQELRGEIENEEGDELIQLSYLTPEYTKKGKNFRVITNVWEFKREMPLFPNSVPNPEQ